MCPFALVRSRLVLKLVLVGLLVVASWTQPEAKAQTIYVSLEGHKLEGQPLHWNDQFVALMQRDGQLVTFTPRDAAGYGKVSDYFSPHSQATLRRQLLQEFGRGFDVSGTGQYLVVHPVGQRDHWADRFEQLYRSMVHYLRARGFTTHQPRFPFIAVVFPSSAQYVAYARKQDRSIGSSTLGYYDPVTNRIQMYDVTANQPDAVDWYVNAETIIHEAAHQTAFNVGIHDRFAETPRWVVEGMGTMFEARGVWNARDFPQIADRVNAYQLKVLRRSAANGRSLDYLTQLISSDDLFRRNSVTAYAHAWALTFYLTEREPRRFGQYIERLKSQDSFSAYPKEDRLRDFVAVFGQDFRMLDARIQRFLNEL